MSRINDALKRASQTDKSGPAPGSAPMAIPPLSATRGPLVTVLLGVTVLLLAALAFWVLQRAIAVPPPPPKPVAVSAPTPSPRPPLPVQSAPLPVAAAPVIVAPVTNAVPSFPRIKLEAIFFTRTNPRALINGQTLGEGDEVGGIKVEKIEPDKVTVQWQERTKIIPMPGG